MLKPSAVDQVIITAQKIYTAQAYDVMDRLIVLRTRSLASCRFTSRRTAESSWQWTTSLQASTWAVQPPGWSSSHSSRMPRATQLAQTST